ncbi:ycf43 [Symbiodinium microadriaticum]|nr:ycf43 [Symbiodinium microadriaticum]
MSAQEVTAPLQNGVGGLDGPAPGEALPQLGPAREVVQDPGQQRLQTPDRVPDVSVPMGQCGPTPAQPLQGSETIAGTGQAEPKAATTILEPGGRLTLEQQAVEQIWAGSATMDGETGKYAQQWWWTYSGGNSSEPFAKWQSALSVSARWCAFSVDIAWESTTHSRSADPTFLREYGLRNEALQAELEHTKAELREARSTETQESRVLPMATGLLGELTSAQLDPGEEYRALMYLREILSSYTLIQVYRFLVYSKAAMIKMYPKALESWTIDLSSPNSIMYHNLQILRRGCCDLGGEDDREVRHRLRDKRRGSTSTGSTEIVKPGTAALAQLPDLTAGCDAALAFQDWLEIASSVLSDVSELSGWWWKSVMEVVTRAYESWLRATPLERLNVGPSGADHLMEGKWSRLNARVASMLLSAMSTEMKGEMESLDEVLKAVRAWPRLLSRCQAVNMMPPDASVLAKGLMSLTDQYIHQSTDAAFRTSMLRTSLRLDGQPTLDNVRSYQRHLQAELETMVSSVSAATAPYPKLKAMDTVLQPKAKDAAKATSGGNGELCRYFMKPSIVGYLTEREGQGEIWWRILVGSKYNGYGCGVYNLFGWGYNPGNALDT